MTPPIRWIERVHKHRHPGMPKGAYNEWTQRVLQYQTDTGEWVDVPVVGDGG